MPTNYLGFNVSIGQKKPENIINTTAKCPFCDRTALTDIIAEEDDLLLIKNKYQVLQNSEQTVLIETRDCNSELSEYSKEHLYKLIKFGVKHWFKMYASNLYKSVLFFKNHGPLSGGTIRHPHMQIVGLTDIDCYSDLDPKEFEGVVIQRSNGVELNVSTYPKIGFSEFNIVMDDNKNLEQLADYIHVAAHYLLHNGPHTHCKSYNIFFYLIDGLIRVKILPRFATSPLFIGYNIHLIPTNIETIVKNVQKLYFSK
ncbi:DUF4931 domain-containing protein [Anaerosinus massiliensis]|uniref:DUF4931 domain-containing protein n=1 Tax=Massilibacillus massiliensis TaxID=1806837 RepID=UPI000AC3B60A|nr:DUF4931 domain-containing protein [Massilibacillus massiliensis]